MLLGTCLGNIAKHEEQIGNVMGIHWEPHENTLGIREDERKTSPTNFVCVHVRTGAMPTRFE